MKKKCFVLILIVILLLSGCGMNRKEKLSKNVTSKDNVSKSVTSKDNAINNKPEKDICSKAPDKSTVQLKRAAALKGMTDADAKRLTSDITKANLRLEQAFMFEDLKKHLSDPKSYTWNYLESTGEILVGYGYEEKDLAKKNSLHLSDKEFEEKYGEKVTTYNEYDAKKMITVLSELRSTVHNKDLRQDFENMIEDVSNAKETHNVQYVINAYRILHDMDYYLLRYGPEDVGKYVQDPSTIDIFYGVLTCYK